MIREPIAYDPRGWSAGLKDHELIDRDTRQTMRQAIKTSAVAILTRERRPVPAEKLAAEVRKETGYSIKAILLTLPQLQRTLYRADRYERRASDGPRPKSTHPPVAYELHPHLQAYLQ